MTYFLRTGMNWPMMVDYLEKWALNPILKTLQYQNMIFKTQLS